MRQQTTVSKNRAVAKDDRPEVERNFVPNRNLSRQRRWQLRMIAEDRCMICGKQRPYIRTDENGEEVTEEHPLYCQDHASKVAHRRNRKYIKTVEDKIAEQRRRGFIPDVPL